MRAVGVLLGRGDDAADAAPVLELAGPLPFAAATATNNRAAIAIKPVQTGCRTGQGRLPDCGVGCAGGP
jgi:hypothetical protein